MGIDKTEAIRRTQEFFLSRFEKSISEEEARMTNERAVKVFILLAKWQKEQETKLIELI